MPDRPRSPRGFAKLSADERRELAKKGGNAAHVNRTGHRWTSAEASAAGRKGGKIKKR